MYFCAAAATANLCPKLLSLSVDNTTRGATRPAVLTTFCNAVVFIEHGLVVCYDCYESSNKTLGAKYRLFCYEAWTSPMTYHCTTSANTPAICACFAHHAQCLLKTCICHHMLSQSLVSAKCCGPVPYTNAPKRCCNANGAWQGKGFSQSTAHCNSSGFACYLQVIRLSCDGQGLSTGFGRYIVTKHGPDSVCFAIS